LDEGFELLEVFRRGLLGTLHRQSSPPKRTVMNRSGIAIRSPLGLKFAVVIFVSGIDRRINGYTRLGVSSRQPFGDMNQWTRGRRQFEVERLQQTDRAERREPHVRRSSRVRKCERAFGGAPSCRAGIGAGLLGSDHGLAAPSVWPI